jgi:hypothetical protein
MNPASVEIRKNIAVVRYTTVDRVSALTTIGAISQAFPIVLNSPSSFIGADPVLSIPTALKAQYKYADLILDSKGFIIFNEPTNNWVIDWPVLAVGAFSGPVGITDTGITVDGQFLLSSYAPGDKARLFTIPDTIDFTNIAAAFAMPSSLSAGFVFSGGNTQRIGILMIPSIICHNGEY